MVETLKQRPRVHDESRHTPLLHETPLDILRIRKWSSSEPVSRNPPSGIDETSVPTRVQLPRPNTLIGPKENYGPELRGLRRRCAFQDRLRFDSDRVL